MRRLLHFLLETLGTQEVQYIGHKFLCLNRNNYLCRKSITQFFNLLNENNGKNKCYPQSTIP